MRTRITGLLPAVLCCCCLAADARAQSGRAVSLMAPVPTAGSRDVARPLVQLGTPVERQALRSVHSTPDPRLPIPDPGPIVRAQNETYGSRPPPPPADGWGDSAGGYFDEAPPPEDFAPPPPLRKAATLGPLADARPVSEYTAMPPPISPEDRYNAGLVSGGMPPAESWLERGGVRSESRAPFDNLFGASDPDPFSSRERFECDRAFDNYISPVTNPFLAEDPRTLTEIRPIFMYQTIPDDQYLYLGGDVEFFGAQGRLAVTERFSVVIHKLGGVRIGPGDGSLLSDEVNFSELHLGPKVNFWRDDFSKLLVSGGVIFQLPIGDADVYQDTGDLTLVPYVTAATPIWKSSWGTFQVMDTLGYAIATDDERSEYFSNSLHLDLDVHDKHRFYPLVELNWLHYTRDGTARPLLGFEFGDLGNTGAAVNGRDYLTIAAGSRYKITENWIIGIAAEFPLVGTRDLNDFRLTADLIWRY